MKCPDPLCECKDCKRLKPPYMKIKAENIDYNMIEVAVDEVANGIQRRIQTNVIRLQDEVVRRCLIDMGWTPPIEPRSFDGFCPLCNSAVFIEQVEKSIKPKKREGK